jgi:hypothetical protein
MVGFAIAAILTIAATLVWRSVHTMRARAAAQGQALVQNGFRTCDGDRARLESRVESLRGAPGFEVREVWRRGDGDDAIYWYEVRSRTAQPENRVVADEFLCTLRRPSEQPLLLYLQPVKLGTGLGGRLIDKLLVVTAPAGMRKLDLAGAEPADGVLAAFGPEGTSLGELLSEQQLAVLARGARRGVFVIRAAGDDCAMELLGAYARKATAPVSWQETWSFVRQVAGSSVSTAAAR